MKFWLNDSKPFKNNYVTNKFLIHVKLKIHSEREREMEDDEQINNKNANKTKYYV